MPSSLASTTSASVHSPASRTVSICLARSSAGRACPSRKERKEARSRKERKEAAKICARCKIERPTISPELAFQLLLLMVSS